MPTLLAEIQSQLDSPSLRDNLAPLFSRTLNWGKPQGSARTIAVGTPVGVDVRAIPIAQLSGLPVFRIDWPKATLPTIIERRAAYHALASTSIEQLICYVTSDSKRAAFVWARPTARHKIELRTLPYEVGMPARTTIERLGELEFTLQELGLLGEPPVTHVLRKLNAAFDVEAVTKKFFERYRELFFALEKQVTGLSDDARRMFTQKLFNRLMFIVFLERKGWLKLNGRTDYLKALWDAHRRERDTDAPALTFYGDRLKLLFFSGLNAPNEVDVVGINPRGMLTTKIGQVPYLNGGLFEEDDDDRNLSITVPDTSLERAIDELFYQFNFTITESTPLDVEVAVDPEMLGKVFEELVTGRHESGSYYTPKPVVAFMCREALKGYLATKVSKEPSDAIAQFVDEHDAQNLHNPEPILEALRQVTVCDPACGSGAYLLGMLQELLQLRAALFATKQIDSRSVYDRKLEIIQNNVYGVDIDPFAVNIARLRLWLSLVVDYNDSNPPPLPNLDYKIEAGDSLLAPDPSGQGQLSLVRPQVEELFKLKDEYLRAHGAEKRALKVEVDALRQSIASMTHANLGDGVLDWQVEFGEVFMRSGFNIVVANPPYVRQELIIALKPTLKRVYPEVYAGVADLYCYFYGRAIQLLCSNGMMSFISPNKWFRAGYGTHLRKYIADEMRVLSITDFGELPVFQTAATFPMIFVGQKGVAQNGLTVFTQVKTLDEPYPDVLTIISEQGQTLPKDALDGDKWTLASSASATLLRKMEAAGISLDKYAHGHIYYGIKTGFNTAFVIDGVTRSALIAQDPKSTEIIKPLAVGDDVRRWRIQNQNQWLIYSPWNLRIDDYPALKRHLSQWQPELKSRPECRDGRYNWWCMARYGADYAGAFVQPKLMYPVIAKESRFAFDPGGMFFNDKVFMIAVNDLYLLGVMNSSFVWQYLKSICSVLGDADKGGRLELRAIYVSKVPIPHTSSIERAAIATLVQQCLDAKGQWPQVAEWEAEINERVARLYGLKPVDVVQEDD